MTTKAAATFGFPRGSKDLTAPAHQRSQATPQPQNSLVIWVTLIGLFFPPISISVGGTNFTPGRLVVFLLFVPALLTFFGSGRKRIGSDFFAVALAVWMLLSAGLNGGFKPYVGAEALEFLGAYLVGRAFFFGPSNVRAFIQALKPIAGGLIALALVDVLSGHYATLDAFGIPNILSQRMGRVRAASVFEGAEHYGSFCVAAASIFFYSERGVRRIAYLLITFVGTFLSLSSGPLMGLCLVTALFIYDYVLRRHRWRWKFLITIIVVFLSGIFIFIDDPLPKIIVHFTLDPQTGFFRLDTWNTALPLIEQSPIIGHGLAKLADSGDALIYLSSIDCVWLLEALRYGLLGVSLLILTMFSPILSGRKSARSSDDVQMGFSLAIVAMGFIGLTVHFWDATWLFLNLCVGIRGSLAEYERGARARPQRSSGLPSVNLASAR